MQKSDIKLVFIIDSQFPYYSGGREAWLYEHCKRLSKDYNITILAMKPPQANKEPFYPISGLHNLKIYHIPSLVNIPIVRAVFPNLTYFSYFLFASLFLFPLLLKREKIIFISLNPGFCYLPSVFMRSKNFRRVCTVHGDFTKEMKKEIPILPKRFLKFLETFSFKDADLVLPCSFYTFDRVKPFCDDNLKVLPNAINLDEFANIKIKEKTTGLNHKKIVCIATLRDIKGVPHLIKSIPYILMQYKKPFKIYFVGKGNPTSYLKLAKDLNVDQYVDFLGERADISHILTNSDISACPFGGGGVPLVVLESMAAGKPIIAWDNDMYRQVLTHEYSGYLVPTADAKALGEGIAYLLKNEDFAESIGRNAQREAEKYDIKKISDRFSDYLRTLY